MRAQKSLIAVLPYMTALPIKAFSQFALTKRIELMLDSDLLFLAVQGTGTLSMPVQKHGFCLAPPGRTASGKTALFSAASPCLDAKEQSSVFARHQPITERVYCDDHNHPHPCARLRPA